MFAPTSTVLVSRASGHLSEAFADGWVKATKRVMEGKQPIHVFNDWTLMEGYDSAARRKLTDWAVSHRALISRTHFTVTSRIVSMGVSVAGAALALASISVESLPRQEFVARLKLALEGERGSR